MNPVRHGTAKRTVNESKNVTKRCLKYNQDPPQLSKIKLKARTSASYDAFVNRVKWMGNKSSDHQ